MSIKGKVENWESLSYGVGLGRGKDKLEARG